MQKPSLLRKANATHIDQPSDGLHFFLYDESYLAELQGSFSKWEPGLNWLIEENHRFPDQKLRKPTKRAKEVIDGALAGKLLCVTMPEDGALPLDIVWGKAPAAAAMNRLGEWSEEKSYLLHLPTGKLCVEGSQALRLNAKVAPESGGDVVKVPAGEYTARFRFIDWDEMDADEWDDDDYESHPQIVLFLDIAKQKTKDLGAAGPHVMQPRGSVPEAPGGEAKSNQGIGTTLYSGFEGEGVELNLTSKDLASLQLKPGHLLQVDVGGEGFATLYLGERDFGLMERVNWEELDPGMLDTLSAAADGLPTSVVFKPPHEKNLQVQVLDMPFGKRNCKPFDYNEKKLPVEVKSLGPIVLGNKCAHSLAIAAAPKKTPVTDKLTREAKKLASFATKCHFVSEKAEATAHVMLETHFSGDVHVSSRVVSIDRNGKLVDKYLLNKVVPANKVALDDILIKAASKWRKAFVDPTSICSWQGKRGADHGLRWKTASRELKQLTLEAWHEILGVDADSAKEKPKQTQVSKATPKKQAKAKGRAAK